MGLNHGRGTEMGLGGTLGKLDNRVWGPSDSGVPTGHLWRRRVQKKRSTFGQNKTTRPIGNAKSVLPGTSRQRQCVQREMWAGSGEGCGQGGTRGRTEGDTGRTVTRIGNPALLLSATLDNAPEGEVTALSALVSTWNRVRYTGGAQYSG